MRNWFFLFFCLWAFAYPNTLSVEINRYNFSSPGVADYDRGYLEARQATTLNINSQDNWQLTVQTNNSDLGVYGKPVTDFWWRKSNSGFSFQPITAQETVVDTGTAGNYVITVDYKMLLNWGRDKPGSYILVLIYNLTPP